MKPKISKDTNAGIGQTIGIVILTAILIFVGYFLLATYTDLVPNILVEEDIEDIFLDVDLFILEQELLIDKSPSLFWQHSQNNTLAIGAAYLTQDLILYDMWGVILDFHPSYNDNGIGLSIKTNAPSNIIGGKWRVNVILAYDYFDWVDDYVIMNEEIDTESWGIKEWILEIPHEELTSNWLGNWNRLTITLYDTDGKVFEKIEYFVVRT